MEYEYDKKKNFTGIPDNMKKQFETSTALSFDDVRVHYNSVEPSKLGALAYTMGTQVYIAPGQEKHLPHELGHVVQQKQGRVKATGNINGMPVNEDKALEREADTFFAGGVRRNSIADRGSNKFVGIMKPPAQMRRRKPNTKVVVKGEANSIFDFEKLKVFLKEIIDYNKNRHKTPWIGEELDEGKLELYTGKVQTLLEDIRQVDLQFLAVAAASFEEEGLIKRGESAENEVYPDDKLTASERESFGERGNAKLQNIYKNIIEQKLQYLKEIRERLGTKEQVESKIKENRRQYRIAVGNHGRAKKRKTVAAMKRVIDRLQRQLENLQSLQKYIKDVEKQIGILESILTNGARKGYVFNINTLLIETDDKIRMYMAIVAPSQTSAHKDLSLEADGTLKAYSEQMQFGIGSPVRSFAWYTKYLMDQSANANNTPIIRSVDMPVEIWDKLLNDMVSEAQKDAADKDRPMNEDQKIPNQFGIPVSSSAFRELLDSNPALTTIGEEGSIPEKMMEGAGEFEGFEHFKEEIGFERIKGGEKRTTDVHFFDFEHTAFHRIQGKDGEKKGKPVLYAPQEAKQSYIEYSQLMDSLIIITGKDSYTQKALELGIIKNALSREELNEKVTELLEANHCLPEGRQYDLHGNSIEALETEQSFASNYISGLEYEKDGKILLDLTKERYKIWYNKMEDQYNQIIISYNNKIQSMSCIQDKQRKEKLRKKYKDNKNIALEELRKSISKITKNGGLMFELQEFGRIDPNNKVQYNKLPVDENEIAEKNIDNFFDSLLKNVFASSQDGKMHVIAFCFKLLRLIHEVVSSNETEAAKKAQELEPRLFAQRASGDYFDVLNRHGSRSVKIGDEDVSIPFDKMSSVGRFKPETNGPKYASIPFIGGASGTTRDISRDLMKNVSLNEDDYWKIQLMNASFMITYSYHSFLEVIYRAAVTRLEYFPEEKISNDIISYLGGLIKDGHVPDNKQIIDDISDIISKKNPADAEVESNTVID